ncbi:hypothetical protein Stube_50280 [Streptomyces tubercidicus]|uniref:Uncharacterized protein n=1 Tax=Streptomyces tubercidicus TaxID=47759 RepID=A0A640V0B9_9ACTN|nr:hypothetical protein Stube_50280 [Streptomyces tubercidicus]
MRTRAALRLGIAALRRRAALGGLRVAGLLGLVRGHLGGRGLLILRTASEHNTQGYVLAAGEPWSDGHDPATARRAIGALPGQKPFPIRTERTSRGLSGLSLLLAREEPRPAIVLEEERIRARTVR